MDMDWRMGARKRPSPTTHDTEYKTACTVSNGKARVSLLHTQHHTRHGTQHTESKSLTPGQQASDPLRALYPCSTRALHLQRRDLHRINLSLGSQSAILSYAGQLPQGTRRGGGNIPQEHGRGRFHCFAARPCGGDQEQSPRKPFQRP